MKDNIPQTGGKCLFSFASPRGSTCFLTAKTQSPVNYQGAKNRKGQFRAVFLLLVSLLNPDKQPQR